MNLYITKGTRDKLRKAFLNMRKQHVISVPDIIHTLGYRPEHMDAYSGFLVNEEIKNQIRSVSRARRAHSIIYSNPGLNEEIIKFLIFYVNENTEVNSVYFLTEENEDEDYYELFDGIVLYPGVKKIHILDCKQKEDSLFSWIDLIQTDDPHPLPSPSSYSGLTYPV
jgi:hypothetical protein